MPSSIIPDRISLSIFRITVLVWEQIYNEEPTQLNCKISGRKVD